jgi:hypothetical protein
VLLGRSKGPFQVTPCLLQVCKLLNDTLRFVSSWVWSLSHAVYKYWTIALRVARRGWRGDSVAEGQRGAVGTGARPGYSSYIADDILSSCRSLRLTRSASTCQNIALRLHDMIGCTRFCLTFRLCPVFDLLVRASKIGTRAVCKQLLSRLLATLSCVCLSNVVHTSQL